MALRFLKGCERFELYCSRSKVNIVSQNYTVLSSLNCQQSNVLQKLHDPEPPVFCAYARQTQVPTCMYQNRRCSNKPADESGPKNADKADDLEYTYLMKMPLAVWPNLLYTIKNVILCKFIIQPYFDNEFTIKDFLAGAKQAVAYVSSQLSSGALTGLEGVVSPEALTEIEKNYKNMSVKERYSLQVSLDDIFFSFPYQIGIIMDDDSKKRYTEITVVYHCLRGLKDLPQEEQEHAPNLDEYQARISILNYRFIKEFTRGVESEWTINRLNHFRAVKMKRKKSF